MKSQEYQVLEHHLSNEARERLENPMKAIWKLAFGRADLISLANGDPHHSLYPIAQVDFKVPSLEFNDPVKGWTSGATKSVQTLSSYKDSPCAVSLQTALQYGAGAGLAEVRETLQQMNELVHSPPHNVVTLTLGNADGLTKCFRLLGNPGDSFLVEEFSFPGMTNAPLAQGVKWVPIRMDKEGILPEVMENILNSWDETVQGRKPHVLYTIPSGQNPTGGTLGIERRREIYRIACQYDLIILEDDPYYFLQYKQEIGNGAAEGSTSFAKQFLRRYPQTLLSMDIEGRVLRVDSFSKVIVPGLRLGWITSNPMFAHKLEVLTDSSTQHPHGLGQAFVAELLSERGWGFDGFFKWVSSLCGDYRRRRDLFIETFNKEMGSCPFASAESPSAGMFIWVEIHYEHHPRRRGSHCVASADSMEILNDELFQRIFDAGVVVMPAKTFAILNNIKPDCRDIPVQERLNFFRVTFAGTDETIVRAVPIFCRVVKDFFGEAST